MRCFIYQLTLNTLCNTVYTFIFARFCGFAVQIFPCIVSVLSCLIIDKYCRVPHCSGAATNIGTSPMCVILSKKFVCVDFYAFNNI